MCVYVCNPVRSRKQVAFLAVSPCFFRIFPSHEIFTPITMRPHQLFTANLHIPQSTVTRGVKWISVGILNHLFQTINNAVIYSLYFFIFFCTPMFEWCKSANMNFHSEYEESALYIVDKYFLPWFLGIILRQPDSLLLKCVSKCVCELRAHSFEYLI